MKMIRAKIYFNFHNSLRRVPDIGYITYWNLIPTIGIRFNTMWYTREFGLALNFLCFQLELKMSVPKRRIKNELQSR